MGIPSVAGIGRWEKLCGNAQALQLRQLMNAVCIAGLDTLVPMFLDGARDPSRGWNVGPPSDRAGSKKAK
jgi:hypothetical protein